MKSRFQTRRRQPNVCAPDRKKEQQPVSALGHGDKNHRLPRVDAANMGMMIPMNTLVVMMAATVVTK